MTLNPKVIYLKPLCLHKFDIVQDRCETSVLNPPPEKDSDGDTDNVLGVAGGPGLTGSARPDAPSVYNRDTETVKEGDDG